MDPTRLRLRLYFGDQVMFGPGKADLLQGIAELGSISAAGRRMNMSYKRAWLLVEEMNRAFTDPLVDSARGGAGGGGAQVTAAGMDVLGHYRRLESILPEAGEAQIAGIRARLRDASGGR